MKRAVLGPRGTLLNAVSLAIINIWTTQGDATQDDALRVSTERLLGKSHAG
jgi:hypothetical protein